MSIESFLPTGTSGWDAGGRELRLGTPGTISRVILLSDGQANHRLVEPVFNAELCACRCERGVSTTTIGPARASNEELMLATASAGGGQTAKDHLTVSTKSSRCWSRGSCASCEPSWSVARAW